MKRCLAALCLAAAPLGAAAQQAEIQRALIERDQQSAEFAARLRGQDVRELENLHARQRSEALQPASPSPDVARALVPYQRERMAGERAQLRFYSPIFRPTPPADQPLPLPGRPQGGVDPVGADRLGR